MSDRLRSEIFVDGIRRHCERAGGFVAIRYKGHPTAGIVWIALRDRDGLFRLYTENFSGSHDDPSLKPADQPWRLFRESIAEADVEPILAKQQAFDEDMWVLEIEGVPAGELDAFAR